MKILIWISGLPWFVSLFANSFNCLDNAFMGRTPAQILVHGFDDLAPRHFRVLEQQTIGGHDHAGSAETALKCPIFSESSLQRMERSVLGQSLNGCNFLPAHLLNWKLAGSYRLSADDHGARAAKARPATKLGPRESQVRPQYPQEHAVAFDL